MVDLKKTLEPLKKDWKCTALFAVAFAFACWQSALQIRSEWGGAAALLILLACLLYQALKVSADILKKGGFPWNKLLAWPPVLIAFALLFLPWPNPDAPGFKFGAWFFLMLGAVCFFCGVRAMTFIKIPWLKSGCTKTRPIY